MTGKAEVYEVQALSNGRWTIQSRCRTETQAVAEAHDVFDRRQCVGVKVVKEAFDDTAQLYRETTVFRLPATTGQGKNKSAGSAVPAGQPGKSGVSSSAAGVSAEAPQSPRRRLLLDIFSGLRSLTTPGA